jgi:hypothetical protein
VADPWVGETRPCPDTECVGKSEPEEDGDLRLWVCTTCGFESHYERVQQPPGNCQLGIPEDVRQRASVSPPQPVFLQIGRRPE